MPTSTGKPPAAVIAAIVAAGPPVVTAGMNAAQMIALFTQFAPTVSDLQTALAPFQAVTAVIPSTVALQAGKVNGYASAVSSDITHFTATPTTVILLQLIADIKTMLMSAGILLPLIQAAGVVQELKTKGCSGYSASLINDFQTSNSILATGIYDAATVTALQGLLGTGTAIPAACPVLVVAPPVTVTPPVVVVQPATPGVSALEVVGIATAVGVVGALGYLIFSTSKEMKTASRASSSMSRLGGALRSNPLEDRPLASRGLTSYRAKGAYGWIMIGARNDREAMNEARRSTSNPTNLEVWNDTRYVPVNGTTASR